MSALEEEIRRIVREELAKQQPANDDAQDLITVAEYVRRCSISESTVRQAISEGRLEVVRIGRAVRIPVDAQIRQRQPKQNLATERAMRVLLGGKAR